MIKIIYNKFLLITVVITTLFFAFTTIFFSNVILAADATGRNSSYVTIVIPVRGREIWSDLSLLKKLYNLIQGKGVASTWLLQYQVLQDKEALRFFKQFSRRDELGLFLEVDQSLADDAKAAYLFGEGDRARADKILLSGYLPEERKRMIDLIFASYKNIFGYYPTSVGAWYIDTLSLDYMVSEYGISSVIDVADQYQTDTYGLWGKPWGVPYYPSRYNSLIPAQTASSIIDVVKIQWAQRDPVLGYGSTVFDSTFSLQANDYSGHNLDIEYFEKLALEYLYSTNPLSQLTLGLEAGQEAEAYSQQFEKQIMTLVNLSKNNSLFFTTMNEFSAIFRKKYPDMTPITLIRGKSIYSDADEAYWINTPYYRLGIFRKDGALIIRDLRLYNDHYIYSDIFQKDQKGDLRRIIPSCIDDALSGNKKVLINDVKDIAADSTGENIHLEVVTNDNRKKVLQFNTEAVYLDDKLMFTIKGKNQISTGIKKFVAGIFLQTALSQKRYFFGGLRFSYVNNHYYWGMMVNPNKIFAVSSNFPYFGVYDFPFQVLIRFRSMPKLNIYSHLLKNFIINNNQCTIKL